MSNETSNDVMDTAFILNVLHGMDEEFMLDVLYGYDQDLDQRAAIKEMEVRSTVLYVTQAYNHIATILQGGVPSLVPGLGHPEQVAKHQDL
jgi:hypothetical protein